MAKLRYLFLVNCILEIAGCPSDDHCPRQTFYDVRNKWHKGQTLLRDGPWPLHKCRRLCRQYLECSSFGIEWLDERYGMCTIYNGVINITKLVDKDRVTLYMPCPEQFQWQKNINKCYSVWLDRVPGTEIVNACKILHPKATPVEPRNKVQMDLIERLVGSRTAWLGIRGAEPAAVLGHLRYYSDGTEITYSGLEEEGWETIGNGQCVAVSDRRNYEWFRVDCHATHDLLCEMQGRTGSD